MIRVAKSIAVAVLLIGSAQAQSVSSGQNEALGFFGAVFGGSHATIGGGIEHAVAPRLLLTGELGYVSSHSVTFDGDVHFLLPLQRNREFTPYLLAGVGVFHVGGNGSHTNAGLNLGGGARWALGKDWGLRPELKFLIADGSSTRLSLGIYKRF